MATATEDKHDYACGNFSQLPRAFETSNIIIVIDRCYDHGGRDLSWSFGRLAMITTVVSVQPKAGSMPHGIRPHGILPAVGCLLRQPTAVTTAASNC